MSASSLSNTGSPRPGGKIAGQHADLGADGVALLAQVIHERFKFVDATGIRTKERIVVDDRQVSRRQFDRPELRQVATYLYAELFAAGICARSHQPPHALLSHAPTSGRRHDNRECRISAGTCSRHVRDETCP